jgi:hypothetical protein
MCSRLLHVAVVFGVVIHGIETTGKVFLSQFFCVSPSNVLAQRRRFEQLIVAQVHDALRFSAQRNAPASLFAAIGLGLDTHRFARGCGHGGGRWCKMESMVVLWLVVMLADASAVLPTAVSVERGETNAGVGWQWRCLVVVLVVVVVAVVVVVVVVLVDC